MRSYAGYRRYDSKEEHRALARLDRLIALKHNLFMPSMKLVAKERVGPRVRRKYSIDTPYNRVLAMTTLDECARRRLKQRLAKTDLLRLLEDLSRAERGLDAAYNSKCVRGRPAAEAA